MQHISCNACIGTGNYGICGPEHENPSNDFTTHDLLNYFERTSDFDVNDTAAIMGVYAMGVAHHKNIGFGNVGKEVHTKSYKLNNQHAYNDPVGGSLMWLTELVHNDTGVYSRYQ